MAGTPPAAILTVPPSDSIWSPPPKTVLSIPNLPFGGPPGILGIRGFLKLGRPDLRILRYNLFWLPNPFLPLRRCLMISKTSSIASTAPKMAPNKSNPPPLPMLMSPTLISPAPPDAASLPVSISIPTRPAIAF